MGARCCVGWAARGALGALQQGHATADGALRVEVHLGEIGMLIQSPVHERASIPENVVSSPTFGDVQRPVVDPLEQAPRHAAGVVNREDRARGRHLATRTHVSRWLSARSCDASTKTKSASHRSMSLRVNSA